MIRFRLLIDGIVMVSIVQEPLDIRLARENYASAQAQIPNLESQSNRCSIWDGSSSRDVCQG